MRRIMFKSKIHRATITEANLNYEGSISIDSDLMEAANIREYEQVSVVNINNGERLETYAIKAPAGSGQICLNGAGARKGMVGDRIIIMTYTMTEHDDLNHVPIVVLVNETNWIISASNSNEDRRYCPQCKCNH